MAGDPLWINASAGAPSYSANELRQAMALALQYNGRTLGARQGVRPGGNALQTSIAGSTITVRAGVACVDPGLTTPQGPYWVALPADETHTLTAAHATLPRKDITVLRVYDHDEDSSGNRFARSEYIAGVAAASPSEPAVPAGAFRLATIDVPASGGGSPSVTLNFPFAVAAGAVLLIRDAAERTALTPFDGLVIYRLDRDWVEIYDGTAWRVQNTAVCSSTADRDAAITSPSNGQLAITTDTGTIWRRHGGAWLETPGTSVQYRAAGFLSTSSTTYTTLSGDPGGSFVAPASGKVWVHVSAAMVAGAAGIKCQASIQVRTGGTVGSGTVVYAVVDDDSIAHTGTDDFEGGRESLVTGLTAGSTYNVQVLYKRVGASSTAGFARRSVGVKPG